jgi:hypothetical protein
VHFVDDVDLVATGEIRAAGALQDALAQRAHVVEVEPVRCEEQVGVEVFVVHERAHEREPVRVQAARRKPDDEVAGHAA